MGPPGTAVESGNLAALDASATAPPWWVVTLALGAGSLFVFGTTYGGHLLVSATTASRQPAPTVAASPPMQPSRPEGSQAVDWRSVLMSGTCDPPCARGPACVANPTACSSGLTCIPGTGREPFAAEETWMLHLSAVQETGPDGKALDPCRTRRDFWVCRGGTTVCASQRDACANNAKSSVGIPITGAEIAARAVVLDVREGSPGATIATTLPIENLVRGGLCNGFGRNAVGGGIGRVTYFLLPP